MQASTPPNFAGKCILVTGGAGFIGSHLIENMLALGAYVRCLDNFSTGKQENLQFFKTNPNFQLLEGDIRDFEVCKEAVKDCDAVSHQAALGSVPRSLNDPISSHAVNVSGFLNMLEASRLEQVKHFVYAASSATYGDANALPKIESEIGEPLSPYAATKLFNEIYAGVYFKNYGFNTIGLRYFNVFGPRQDPEGAYAAVIPKFISSLMECESPVINGDGSFSRDYTYIENVVQANLLALTATKKRSLNEVYNIAYGEQTTLLELVREIKERLLNYNQKVSEVEPIFGPERKGDVPHSLASITKARHLLGYDPGYDLKTGLTETVEWYYKNLN
ncbi:MULTISPECIES: SDR family oxidoreductase [unclassified Leeuwenhoekiella]|uniref:SDR family oxidoreductase n=1 Tax=unclassified Leeuwenhoekiella TaxID=2615029 RepID=UPI000C3CBA54|nr:MULTISPECIES: SDR family oxidoreductase [unclassified Leeuwenhoekiella]MAW94821.1 LPS biosynthesis protein WbpP [Leeuwenhoekiella sp.]MBA79541.1 LPS biosynthesis protein WbpP [Leeuwenhoekiella sp.]|tara:strand:- start:13140 stop:14138 length:999 start_codon:yes stop_codon:yes gene_type:complete